MCVGYKTPFANCKGVSKHEIGTMLVESSSDSPKETHFFYEIVQCDKRKASTNPSFCKDPENIEITETSKTERLTCPICNETTIELVHFDDKVDVEDTTDEDYDPNEDAVEDDDDAMDLSKSEDEDKDESSDDDEDEDNKESFSSDDSSQMTPRILPSMPPRIWVPEPWAGRTGPISKHHRY
ncbi:MAG: hypothetical protein M1834_001424 [Cirrosporium novae-zelandiae]|nr:MAG: hypothetical protein M1834_001424 [Cirrosporium novae-zelandiae]